MNQLNQGYEVNQDNQEGIQENQENYINQEAEKHDNPEKEGEGRRRRR